MLATNPGFFRIAEGCRKKFENIFKSYKEDKLGNSIFGTTNMNVSFMTP